MPFLTGALLGLGLSVDAGCVSMTNGLSYPKLKLRKAIFIAFMFGFFQAFMPFLGYMLGSLFATFISKFTPYIALLLLGFLGGKMIFESFKKDEEVEVRDLSFKELFTQSIATSIDALSVGIILINYKTSELIFTILAIGIITFIISLICVYLGKKFGTLLKDKAMIVGGIVLILIGVEIFLSGAVF